MKKLNQFDTKKNMSKSFTKKKYWVLIFCLLFCSLKAVAQQYSDETIGFDVVRETVILKKYGVSDQNLSKELNIKRKIFTRRYLTLEKSKKTIFQNINLKAQVSQKSPNSTARTMAVTAVDVPQSEKDVLQAFYNIAQNKTNLKGWNFSNPVTSWNSQNQTGWTGVTVTDGHVTELRFDNGVNLNGNIPSIISQLSQLKKLSLQQQPNLTGLIPASIGQLSELETLNILYTKLSGTIPNQIGQLSKLTDIMFFSNELTGDIPQEIFQLRNLEFLSMHGFTGYIPNSVGQLNKLYYLDLGGVSLRGTLPAELGQLSELTYLSIFNSPDLTGTIPNGIFQIPNLVELFIGGCPNLTGSLPNQINQPNIQSIYLNNNNLNGQIPVFNCPNLGEIFFNNNQFSSISTQFGQSTAPLIVVNLGYNKLSGPISPSLFQLQTMELNLSHNELNGSLPTNIGNVTILDLSYNKFTGSIPLFSNITNMNELHINNNQLSGPISNQVINSLPPNLIKLDIQSNKYTFLDLINAISENPAFESRVNYWPQGKIGQPKTVDTTVDYVVGISMDNYTGSPDDTFQWYKGISPDGVLYQNPGTNSNDYRLVFEDVAESASGYYYFKTKSRFFGDNFVMESEPIKLNVLCYPQTTGSLNVVSSDLVVGQPINFSFESATPNLTYKWTFYNLTGEVSGTSTLSNATVSQRYGQPGEYKIKLEVTQQSCITTFEKTFTVASCTPILGIIKTVKNTNYSFQFSNSGSTSILACNETAFPNKFYTDTQTLNIGTKLYTNESLSIPVTTANVWYKTQNGATTYKIDAAGKIIEIYFCSTVPVGHALRFSTPGRPAASQACPATTFPDTFYAASSTLGIGTQLYLDPELKNGLGSGNSWRKEGIDGQTIRIDNDGRVAEFSDCGQPATNTYKYRAIHPYKHPETDFVIYIDASGVQRQINLPRGQGGEQAPCTEIVARSIVTDVGVVECQE